MWDLIVSVPDHCLSFYFIVLWIKKPEGLLYSCNENRYVDHRKVKKEISVSLLCIILTLVLGLLPIDNNLTSREGKKLHKTVELKGKAMLFILSWRFGHEKISVILPLPLIQEEQLSVTGERMCTKYW